MQITAQGLCPAIGMARTCSTNPPSFVGADLPRWHPYLSLDRDRERANLTLRRIHAARIQASVRLGQSGHDHVTELDALVRKHLDALRGAAVISLASFLSACERLIEDVNAL